MYDVCKVEDDKHINHESIRKYYFDVCGFCHMVADRFSGQHNRQEGWMKGGNGLGVLVGFTLFIWCYYVEVWSGDGLGGNRQDTIVYLVI